MLAEIVYGTLAVAAFVGAFFAAPSSWLRFVLIVVAVVLAALALVDPLTRLFEKAFDTKKERRA